MVVQRDSNVQSIVLLSGGQLSTFCLFKAVREAKRCNASVKALFVDYGQPSEERVVAERVAEMAGACFSFVEAKFLGEMVQSTLTDNDVEDAHEGGYPSASAPGGYPTDWVPGRAQLLLSAAQAFAMGVQAREIWVGFGHGDGTDHPESHIGFLHLARTVLATTGGHDIVLRAPMNNMDRPMMLNEAWELGPVAWDAMGRSLSCHRGERPGCGQCLGCQRRASAYSMAGATDAQSALPLMEALKEDLGLGLGGCVPGVGEAQA